MNTKKSNSYRGVGIYIFIILAVIAIWFWLGQNTTSNSYTKSDFEKALKSGDVVSVEVVQNREIPTGSLKIKLKNNDREVLYASDVNEMQQLMDEYKFSKYTCDDTSSIFACVWCNFYIVYDCKQ